MSEPVTFNGANKTLGAPKGRDDDIAPLPVYSNGVQCVSCWQLSPEEAAEVARTGRVFVNVLYGGGQPPIYVGASLAGSLF